MKAICPMCMDRDAEVAVSLNDGETITCGGCDESYKASEVRAMVESWGPLLKWLEQHPAK